MTEERRLVAVLALDVVGYSRMMERDESGTLQRLEALSRILQDDAEGSEVLARAALARNPRYDVGHLTLAVALRRLGRNEEAKNVLTAFNQLRPNATTATIARFRPGRRRPSSRATTAISTISPRSACRGNDPGARPPPLIPSPSARRRRTAPRMFGRRPAARPAIRIPARCGSRPSPNWRCSIARAPCGAAP
jgi:hypothetical protein